MELAGHVLRREQAVSFLRDLGTGKPDEIKIHTMGLRQTVYYPQRLVKEMTDPRDG